ncbi:MAG: hypothetical protein AAGJ80_04045 [Cyanobacteria bacterium J06553_1]
MTNATPSAQESMAKLDAMTADIKGRLDAVKPGYEAFLERTQQQVDAIDAEDVQRALDTMSKGAATSFVLFAVAVITLVAMSVELWKRHGMTARCKRWAIAAARVWVAGVSVIALELPPVVAAVAIAVSKPRHTAQKLEAAATAKLTEWMPSAVKLAIATA